MNYQVSSIKPDEVRHLFGLEDAILQRQNVIRMTVTRKPGFPCRVTLQDAEIGESVLLLNYEHQPANSPYRSTHAIFVRENATESATFENEIPEQLRIRQLSVRSFDDAGMMVAAARGCYLARVDRN